MIFVVAIDPESVQTLIDRGELGEDQLLGIFEALLQNCLLAETSTWRVGSELRETARKVKDPDIKKKIWSILEIFGNPEKNRFVDVIDGYEADWDTGISDIIASQGNNRELDVAICEKVKNDGFLEFVSGLKFNSSNFARDRSRSACALIYAPGCKRADELLQEAFGRLVRHATTIEIYDRQMGKTFGGSYHEAIPYWCDFLEEYDRELNLIIHTTRDWADAIEREFNGNLKHSKVHIGVRSHLEDQQPHDRFLRACHFTLDIGRGVDLFDRDGWCRDVKIGISNHSKFTEQWRSLSKNTDF
jgi:hypothetical protein